MDNDTEPARQDTIAHLQEALDAYDRIAALLSTAIPLTCPVFAKDPADDLSPRRLDDYLGEALATANSTRAIILLAVHTHEDLR